jgi:DNA polymerase-3 subunit epsilon
MMMNTSKHVRQVVLDTETTGMNKDGTICLGHRIIEVGCVEVINRQLTGRHFHFYIQPDMKVDPEAQLVHGISDDFLKDKPRFAEIADEFIDFIKGSEIIAHNAPFDISFIDQEFRFLNKRTKPTEQIATVLDTLVLAKKMFPGKRNNLDALSDRYGISTQHRVLHGALLDAEILAEVYLLMSGGQVNLNLTGNDSGKIETGRRDWKSNGKQTIVYATDDELAAHQTNLESFKDAKWLQ